MQMTAKLTRLSQDDWHCATLEDIFEKDFFLNIQNGLSSIKWVEAKKDFYIQREANLRHNEYYKDIFSSSVCEKIKKNIELFFDKKFEIDFDITAHKMISGDYIGIHTDANPYGESHRLTVMLNDLWDIAQGGVLLTLNGSNLSEVRDAWLPTANTGLLFEIGEKSYHAVTPVKGDFPRYSIIFTFKKVQDVNYKKSPWSPFPLIKDLTHAASTASLMGINESIFYQNYIGKKFISLQEFSMYVDNRLDNAPIGFSYKNGRSINVDQNGIQSKGSDRQRIDKIHKLKRIPPIIIVKRKNGSYVLVDGSHRLSYAKDHNMDIHVVFYQEGGFPSKAGQS